jgi:uncharacterized membrane protein
MNKRVLAIAFLAFLGMIDTFYITIMSRQHATVECHVTEGCNDVLTSKYSKLAGIPISLFGLAFYLSGFSCAIAELTGAAKLTRLLFWPALGAFLVSVSLTSIQAFVLEKYCEYCLASALLSTSIFVLCSFRRGDQKI